MSRRPFVFMAAWLTAATCASLPFRMHAEPLDGVSAACGANPSGSRGEPERLAPRLCAQQSTGQTAPEPPRHDGAGGTAASPAPAAGDPRGGGFRIGPEDVLDVQVWKNPELSRVVPVRPDGMISLPLVNDIKAAGLTPIELRGQITQRLSEFVPAPEVSVIVREVHSVKVAVLGAVKMPGHYEVNSTATVLELIARAQGLTEFADRGRIVVLRQEGTATKRIPFNYRKVAEGSEQDNFVVQPGDIIVVP